MDLNYLEGKTICVVFCQLKPGIIVDESDPDMAQNFNFQYLHGRANILNGKQLKIENPKLSFVLPISCYSRIFPNDGTDILGSTEYFVMVKVDEKFTL